MGNERREIVPGTVIDGRVRLVRRVGRGGMGEVWAAEHIALGTEVAVKLLSSALAADAEAALRFSREARAAAKIKSPHVVQIHDHGVHEGKPYIVMELLEGETLSELLEREQRLAPDQALSIVTQACKALAPAHAIGIVHRDLKPPNLFLARVGNETFVKVLDFGIVKLLGATPLTAIGATVGTASYMSPEQVSGSSALDHRSDLFSLAVITYRMLTGKRPFQGASPVEIMVAITEGRFLAPSRHRPELPPALDVWFSRALAADPAQRHQSAQELADSLAAALRPDTSLAFAATARQAVPVATEGIAPTLISPTLRSNPPPATTVSSGPTLASPTEVAGFVPPPAPPAYSAPPPPQPRSAVPLLVILGLGLATLGAFVVAITVWLVWSASPSDDTPAPAASSVGAVAEPPPTAPSAVAVNSAAPVASSAATPIPTRVPKPRTVPAVKSSASASPKPSSSLPPKPASTSKPRGPDYGY